MSCILIWLQGGPSQIDTFDPKPDAPTEVRGPFRQRRTGGDDLAGAPPLFTQIASRHLRLSVDLRIHIFAARTRAVLLAPYEKQIDSGEPLRYGQLSSNSRDAWLKIAAAVAEGL